MDTNKFSNLPDHVIDHILSLLPTRDAVRTKFISKRFWSCWTHLSAFDFEEEVYEGEKFQDFVSHVLDHNINDLDQIHRLRLKCFAETLDGKLRMEVQNWLQIVVTTCKQLQVCHLGFPKHQPGGPARHQMTYSSVLVPPCMFTGSPNSLVELTLTDCMVELHQPSQLASLKILSLSQVDIKNESFQNIILGCPLLQQVSVVDCNLLNTMDLSTLSNGSKRSLRLLSYFVTMVDISSITDADMCIYPNRFDLKTLMDKIRHLQSITARDWLIEIFAYFERNNLPCPPNSWKYVCLDDLSLMIFGVGWIPCLLRNSPCLEELIIMTERNKVALKKKTILDLTASPVKKPKIGPEHQEFGYVCPRNQLKKVTICGYMRLMHELMIELAKLVLENAYALEELVVEKARYATSQDMQKFSQALLAMSVASKHVKVTILF